MAFLESDGEYDYVLMVQASDDFDATSRSGLNSELPIDREALQVLGEAVSSESGLTVDRGRRSLHKTRGGPTSLLHPCP